jgi:hypothetical protein
MRRAHAARHSAISCLGIALLVAPLCRSGAQAAADASPAEWRGWAFLHLGPAQTSAIGARDRDNAILASLSGGVAGSYGAILGMFRATDTERLSFSSAPGVQDYAVLAGARSRGDRLFVVGAAGIAQAMTTNTTGPTGAPNSNRQFVPAFDLSAHADYRVAGLALTVSGVVGPKNIRYVAISLGAELGWFGF